MSYLLDLIDQKAKQNKKTIVLAEGEEIRTLQATEMILNDNIANIILLGDKNVIAEKAKGLDIGGARIIDPKNAPNRQAVAEELFNLRKAKGLTEEQAETLALNPLYFGVMMVHMGEADGMVAGAINSTGDVLRPALQILKTAPGIKIVSSFFIMSVPDSAYGNKGMFVFSDCAMNIDPTSEELSEIAIASANSYKSFLNDTPRVAMLSHSTYGSSKGPMVDKVREAAKLVKEKAPDLSVDGELQLDAAIIPSIGKLKAPTSEVAGSANVLVFPTLDAANIGYKLVERLAKAEAYGPVTQGIRKPVNDLSRGCSAKDIRAVVAITCVQCH